MRKIVFAVLLVAATARADTSTLQRYLIPIYATSVPGAFGSLWQTEWTISNSGVQTLNILAPRCPAGSLCPDGPVSVEPNAEARPVLYPQAPAPNAGILIFVSTDQAPSFASELRIRDLSQQAQSWGAEMPLVNTSEFRTSIRLLDIPADPAFRVLLRIYGLSQSAVPVDVRVRKSDQVVALAPSQSSFAPSYAQVAIPSGTAGEKLRIDVTSLVADQPIWAFASITNNSTQELTLVTPQPIPKAAAASPASLAIGHWGGGGACLDVTSTSVTLIDTRADKVTFTPPTVDANGHFEVDGLMVACTPGPALEPFTVHISGDVAGATVTITISGNRSVGPMTLTFGSTEQCNPCLLL